MRESPSYDSATTSFTLYAFSTPELFSFTHDGRREEPSCTIKKAKGLGLRMTLYAAVSIDVHALALCVCSMCSLLMAVGFLLKRSLSPLLAQLSNISSRYLIVTQLKSIFHYWPKNSANLKGVVAYFLSLLVV